MQQTFHSNTAEVRPIYLKIGHIMRKPVFFFSYEPPHDKTNKMTMHPAKTRISLGIRPV